MLEGLSTICHGRLEAGFKLTSHGELPQGYIGSMLCYSHTNFTAGSRRSVTDGNSEAARSVQFLACLQLPARDEPVKAQNSLH